MNLNDLKKPFQPTQHQFNYQSWAYIDEDAICERLDDVVGIGNWKVTQPYAPQQVTATHYIATVELAIKIDGEWVVRVGTGEGTTSINNARGDNDPLDDPRYVSNMGENAAKAAATDALRRAARLWGVGRYLLKLPKDNRGKPTITDHQQLRKWLIDNFVTDDDKPTPPSPPGPSNPKKDPTPAPTDDGYAHDASGNGQKYKKQPPSGVMDNLKHFKTLEPVKENMTDAEKLHAWLETQPMVDIHTIGMWELPRGRKEMRWTAWATADDRDDLRITLFSEDIARIGEFIGQSVKDGHEFGGYPIACTVRPDGKYHVRILGVDPSLQNKAAVKRVLDEGKALGFHIEDVLGILGVSRFSDYVGTVEGVINLLKKRAGNGTGDDFNSGTPSSVEKPNKVRNLPTSYAQKPLLDMPQHQRAEG